MKKIFRYFFYIPLISLIFKIVSKLNNNQFVFFFNLFSFFHKSKERIYIKNNSFFFKNIDWKFVHKKLGLYFYGKSLKARQEELKNAYHLKNINFEDDDIIIDIGANNGDFYLCFEKQIKYYAFEPSPIIFSNLEYNVKNQNLFNKALWNKSNKSMEFFISDDWGDSSLIPIKNYSEKVLIETTTLDEVIDEISKPIKLIKLEAEGAEPEILEGLKKNLSLVHYITIDCGFERGIEQKSTIAECSNYLIKNNFEIIDFGSHRIIALFKNKKF